MQINDLNGPSENEEIQNNHDAPGRVTEANSAEVRKRLKDIALKKSRERLSLLERSKENIIARAEERKEELINAAAVDYDLDKKEIEKRYEERMGALRAPKSDSESDSVFSALASESEPAKTPGDLIKEMNALLDRLDSTLHFSEDEKSRIKDSLALKAQEGAKGAKEIEALNEGMEGLSADFETIQRINVLKANMQIEMLEIEERFGSAVKGAEEEHQRILNHLSNVAENVLAEKKRALVSLRLIDSADLETLEAMLNIEEPVGDGKIVLTEEDSAVRLNMIRTFLFSAAAVSLFGVTVHIMNKEQKAEPVLKNAPAVESIMRFKVDPQAFFQAAPVLLNSNGGKNLETVKKSEGVKKSQLVKAKKDPIGNLEKAVKGLEKKVDLMLLIERNREQLDRTPGDGIILLKKSTKSIAKRFLVNLELELRSDRLGDRQKAALFSMMGRMYTLLKIKEKNKKADITSLRSLRDVSAEGFSLNSIRKFRKGIDKAIGQQKPKVRPSKVRKR